MLGVTEDKMKSTLSGNSLSLKTNIIMKSLFSSRFSFAEINDHRIDQPTQDTPT